MKKLFILSAVLAFSGPSFAYSIGFKAFGSGNAISCTSSRGIYEANLYAEEQALKAANKHCHFGLAEVKELKIINSYRGSCWAGTNSGVVIELLYTCASDDISTK